MANKYQYKGTDITSIVQSGASTIPTNKFNGFPTYTTSNDSFSKIDTDIKYSESGQSLTSKYPITGAVTQILANTVNATIGSIQPPIWANSMKFIVASTTGDVGNEGPQGPSGSGGPQGFTGPQGHANNCPQGQKKRPRDGGPGGPGGFAGPGGAGGPGGPGGPGAYIFTSSVMGITQSTPIQYNIGNGNTVTFRVDTAAYVANRGAKGNQGAQGGRGNDGGRGNQGGQGSNNCPNSDAGGPGSRGTAGNTGNQGAAGNIGVPGNVTIPPIVGGTGNATTSQAYINVYFFKT
jgi:hypothetical protein